MDQAVKDYAVEKVNDLINAPSCCAEAKAAGQNWLKALGTAEGAEATKKLIAEVEADIMPIDGLIAFASSPVAAQVFGEEGAKGVLAHAQEIKAAGAQYCDCPACAACAAIIAKKNEILA